MQEQKLLERIVYCNVLQRTNNVARLLLISVEKRDFNPAFFQFIWECNSENTIKSGPYLPKLLQEKFGAVFLAHPVYAGAELSRNHAHTCRHRMFEQHAGSHTQFIESRKRGHTALHERAVPPSCPWLATGLPRGWNLTPLNSTFNAEHFIRRLSWSIVNGFGAIQS